MLLLRGPPGQDKPAYPGEHYILMQFFAPTPQECFPLATFLPQSWSKVACDVMESMIMLLHVGKVILKRSGGEAADTSEVWDYSAHITLKVAA